MSRGGGGRILNKPFYGKLRLRFYITLLTKKVPLSLTYESVINDIDYLFPCVIFKPFKILFTCIRHLKHLFKIA